MNIYYFGNTQYFLVNGKLVDRHYLDQHINNQPICRLLDLAHLENLTKFTFSEAAMFSLCFRHRMEITQCDNEPEYGLTTYQVADSEDGDYYGEWVGSPELGFKFTLYDPIEFTPKPPKVDVEPELEVLPEEICPACESGKLKKTNRPYAHWANMKRYTVPDVPQEICNNQNCNAKWLSPGVWSLVDDFVANNEPDQNDPVTLECKGRKHVLLSYWLKDADGYPLERVCDTCRAKVLSKYRADILTKSSSNQDDFGDDSDQ